MYTGTVAQSPQGLYEVSVIIAGQPQPLYRRLDGQLFVVGYPDTSYQLLVRNLRGSRMEIISTIDGRNTQKDEPGDQVHNQGLVIPGHGQTVIQGWRLNDQNVRKFFFGTPERSIAAQATGTPDNIGIIGFAAYGEKGSYGMPFPPYGAREDILPSFNAPGSHGTMKSAAPAPSAAPRNQIGTGMGEQLYNPVGHTIFRRTETPPEILTIQYDTEEVLAAMGIIAPPEPNAFPGQGTGYDRYTPSR